MSGAGAADSSNPQTTKATTDDAAHAPSDAATAAAASAKKAPLEEDDEFEDFPVDDWEDAEAEGGPGEGGAHLWEESWDDDDTSDDFAAMLREELQKVDSKK